MRDLPADVVIDPMPTDFRAVIQDISSPQSKTALLKATVIIDGSRYELGQRPMKTKADMEQAVTALNEGIWQLQELGRLGRTDLMAYASTERHAGVKPSIPDIPAA